MYDISVPTPNIIVEIATMNGGMRVDAWLDFVTSVGEEYVGEVGLVTLDITA
jgi:hypothetical protein